MPNWFSGNFTITGTKEQMKPIYDWTQFDDVLGEDEGFNKLVPLPTPNGEWDYDMAIAFWGSKWGVSQVQHIYATETRVEIEYQSAWTAPTGLFYQLEKKYGVSVSAEGAEQEGCPHICLYENGKYLNKNYEYDDVFNWADDDDLQKEEDFEDEDDWVEYKDEVVYDNIHEFLQEKYEEMRGDMSNWDKYVPKVKIEEEDNSIALLEEKIQKRRKETKDFLKMIEKTDISTKMATTKDEEQGDCWEGRKCQEDEFGHCVVCCECRKCCKEICLDFAGADIMIAF